MRHINYTGRLNKERDAVRDLCQWFGFRRSRLIARAAKHAHNADDPMQYMKQLDIAINMGGVEGYPIFCAFRRWVEPKLYEQWYDGLPD